MKTKLRNCFIIFFVYSLIGWIYELLIFYYHGKGWINRGFLYGPYLPVYGFGMLLLVSVLRKVYSRKKKDIKDWIIDILIVLVSVFLIATLVEYITHYVMDTFFGIKLWDYTKDYLNINGRVCFAASRNFAIGGTLLIYLVQPLVDRFIKNTKNKSLDRVSILLFIIIVIDLIVTVITKYLH